MTTLLKTPLHAEHLALKGRMVPFAGYEMPVQYSGLLEEHKAVRTAAGIFDVSHMGELFLSGPRAEALIDSLITGDLTVLPHGKALYTVACNAEGTILDDLIVYRFAAERFMIVCNASNREKIVRHFAKHSEGVCEFVDASDDYALLALQGPKAVEIMRRLEAADIANLASFALIETTLCDVAVIVARTGYTAEDGFEIFCKNRDAAKLWNVCVQHGALPCGLGARDTLRLEGRLSLYGNDIDETTNPLEAGLGWVVKLEKSRDFLGKAKLVQIQAAGLSRKMVGIEMVGRGIARHGYAIVDASGKAIGHVTSGCPGPTVGKNIALGYVPTSQSAIGTSITVAIRDQMVEAVVVKTPFYKRSV